MFIRPDLALFIVRLTLGSTFIIHGGQKVFGWLGGPGLHGWLNYLATIGVTNHMIGYCAAFFEFLGGILVLTGVAAEVGAGMILCNMIAAILLIHCKHGYFLPNGMEYALNLALLCIVIIVGGSGSFALWDVRNLF